VLVLLRAHLSDLAPFGVKSLALFGSVARDEARADSDLDVLVEFEGPATFDGYMGLKLYLEDLLGSRVDLVMKKALRSRMLPLVEREAVRVA
jgi:predicted nucleotidyltransferase